MCRVTSSSNQTTITHAGLSRFLDGHIKTTPICSLTSSRNLLILFFRQLFYTSVLLAYLLSQVLYCSLSGIVCALLHIGELCFFVYQQNCFCFSQLNRRLSSQHCCCIAGHATSFCQSDKASDALATTLSSCILRHGVTTARHSQPLHCTQLSSQDCCLTGARARVLEQTWTQ